VIVIVIVISFMNSTHTYYDKHIFKKRKKNALNWQYVYIYI
jgi:hypothetical protein